MAIIVPKPGDEWTIDGVVIRFVEGRRGRIELETSANKVAKTPKQPIIANNLIREMAQPAVPIQSP